MPDSTSAHAAMQARINDLAAQLRAAREQLATARAEIAQLRAAPTTPGPAGPEPHDGERHQPLLHLPHYALDAILTGDPAEARTQLSCALLATALVLHFAEHAAIGRQHQAEVRVPEGTVVADLRPGRGWLVMLPPDPVTGVTPRAFTVPVLPEGLQHPTEGREREG